MGQATLLHDSWDHISSISLQKNCWAWVGMPQLLTTRCLFDGSFLCRSCRCEGRGNIGALDDCDYAFHSASLNGAPKASPISKVKPDAFARICANLITCGRIVAICILVGRNAEIGLGPILATNYPGYIGDQSLGSRFVTEGHHEIGAALHTLAPGNPKKS